MATDPSALEGANEAYCYLTTTGRRSGKAHTIEIWFAIHQGALYMLAGDHRSDWVLNIRKTPAVQVRLGREDAPPLPGKGRAIDAGIEPELDATVRRLLAGKYQGWREGRPLSEWAQTALAVEVRFD